MESSTVRCQAILCSFVWKPKPASPSAWLQLVQDQTPQASHVCNTYSFRTKKVSNYHRVASLCVFHKICNWISVKKDPTTGSTCVVAPATTHILVWPKLRMPIYYSYFFVRKHSSHNSVPGLWLDGFMTQYYCFVDRCIIKFSASDSQRVKVILTTALRPTSSSLFLVQCMFFQYVTSVICIKWSVFILYLCIYNIWLLWHQCLPYLPEQGMMNNIIQYFNLLQFVTGARRRLIVTVNSVSCYMLIWARLKRKCYHIHKCNQMLLRSK